MRLICVDNSTLSLHFLRGAVATTSVWTVMLANTAGKSPTNGSIILTFNQCWHSVILCTSVGCEQTKSVTHSVIPLVIDLCLPGRLYKPSVLANTSMMEPFDSIIGHILYSIYSIFVYIFLIIIDYLYARHCQIISVSVMLKCKCVRMSSLRHKR